MNDIPKTSSRGRTERTRSWRGYVHAAIAVAAWILFFYWWRQVLGFTRRQDVVFVLVFLLVAVAAATALNLAWVRHNVGIYRRKGPRTRVTEVSEDWGSDTLGRPVRWPPAGSVLRSRIVTVSADDRDKIVTGETVETD